MRFAYALGLILSLAALTGCNDSKIAGLPPGIDVQPETLTFGAVAPGQTDTKTVTISNHGGGVLAINSLDLGGDTPASFSTDADASAMPLSLAPGASVLVQVTYAPGETGPHAGVLTIHSTDGNRPAIDVALVTGTLAPQLVVTPDALAFGTVTTGQVHLLSFLIENAGNGPLEVSDVSLGGSSAAYSVFPPALPLTLAPGSSVSVPVSFAPTSGGAQSGVVNVASSDPSVAPATVTLSGNGTLALVPDIFATPASLAFGNVDRGSCKTLTTSIGNQGLATLNVSNVTRATGTSAEYTFAPTVFSVAPGQASDLSVTYCPADGGIDTGALKIASNDPDTSVLQLPVSGKGLIPIPANTDIAVQLEWDKPNTDVDLHVMRMTTAGTFAWNTSDDCYYSNCKQVYTSKPDWGVVGDHTDDPYLDQDVVTGSPGPENINLAIAQTTTYRVGAYYFGDHGNGPTNATMRIWLNNNLVFESAPMHIINLERWVAADIAWDASTDTGTVTAVGTTMQMFSFAQQTK